MEIGVVKPIDIEEEMKGAYLDYAMSVITARALPDVRDGLKPVQRRILYAMDELGLRHTSPYKKSARIVGEVLGKYHPHGDAPVYESMVRMAQDFSMRYPLVDGQGNFGSVDGDPPAAMRYTEARLTKIAEEMLLDIDKDTVDFVPNFDGSLKEPSVLPARLPNLLVNGSAGIAVGMATNIPPHNLAEIVDATSLIINRFAEALEGGIPFKVLWSRVQQTKLEPEELAGTLQGLTPTLSARVLEEARKLSSRPTAEHKLDALIKVLDDIIAIAPDDLMAIVKGPDFPTAGIIIGEEGIKNAYATGHGRIIIRARAHVEDIRGGRQQIVVTELPFQVNKAALIEKIAELVRDRRIEGISELRDESDRQGMRVVIELKRDAQAKQTLNQLYKYTSMQNSFSINMLALVEGQPRVLTLKMLLMQYIRYRRDVIIRRTEFDLARARHRAHILEGLKIALDNLDEVIATIRRSPDAETARVSLMKKFKLSEVQAQAILDMQLRRLAALERKKILDEYAEVLKLIAYLEDLLAKPAKILYLIRDELAELKQKYGDPRRTRILTDEKAEFTEEDLIPDQEVTVVLTARGYIKRLAADAYRVRRASRAGNGALTKEDDPVQHVLLANMLDTLVVFSNRGRAYQIRVRDLADTSRQSRGVPLSTLVQLDEGEKVTSIVAVRALSEGSYFVLVTRGGEIKRIASGECSSTRSSGLIVMHVAEGDELAWADVTPGKTELLIATERGQAIRFSEEEVRPSGRASGGVRAIRMVEGDRVVSASLVQPGSDVVVMSRQGFAKRTPVDEYPLQGRGGGGVRAATLTGKTGPLVAARVARPGDSLVVVTSEGAVAKLAVEDVPSMGRAAQGASLLSLDKGDAVLAVSHVPVPHLEGKPTPDDGRVSPETGASGGAESAPGVSISGPMPTKVRGRSERREREVAKVAVKEAERIVSAAKPAADPAGKASKAAPKRKAAVKQPKLTEPKKSGQAVPAETARKAKQNVQPATEPSPSKARGKARVGGLKNQDQAAEEKLRVSDQGAVKAPRAFGAERQSSAGGSRGAPTPKSAQRSPSAQAATPPPAAPRPISAGPGESAKFTSTRLVKRDKGSEAAATAQPIQPSFQGWMPVADLAVGGQSKRAAGRAGSSARPTDKAPTAPKSKSRSTKSQGKSSSLIGSIASKLSGKKESPGAKKPGR